MAVLMAVDMHIHAWDMQTFYALFRGPSRSHAACRAPNALIPGGDRAQECQGMGSLGALLHSHHPITSLLFHLHCRMVVVRGDLPAKGSLPRRTHRTETQSYSTYEYCVYRRVFIRTNTVY